MKISILDISNSHFGYLKTVYKIFGEFIEEIYLSEFLSNELYKELKIKSNKVKKVNDKYISFFKIIGLIKVINRNKIDILFINTMQSNYIFFFFLFMFCNKKILLSIHNINCYYEKPKGIKGKIRCFIRRYALKKSKFVNVYGENLKNYLKGKGYHKIATSIPYSAYEDKKQKLEISNSDLVFSIPGGFSTRRRDYLTVYNVFKNLEEKELKIKLYLLGKLGDENSKELFDKFKKLKNVKYFEKYVGEKEFDEIMQKSDLIIGPLNKEIEFEKGIKEEYGVSKESGFTFAQITYSKPGLLPSYIEKFSELKNSCLLYKNENELYNIIVKLYENREELKKLKGNAEKNAKQFTYLNIKRKFLKDIGE